MEPSVFFHIFHINQYGLVCRCLERGWCYTDYHSGNDCMRATADISPWWWPGELSKYSAETCTFCHLSHFLITLFFTPLHDFFFNPRTMDHDPKMTALKVCLFAIHVLIRGIVLLRVWERKTKNQWMSEETSKASTSNTWSRLIQYLVLLESSGHSKSSNLLLIMV